jgi:hypothetical protein
MGVSRSDYRSIGTHKWGVSRDYRQKPTDVVSFAQER